jgi:hypothetical protein
MAATAAAIKAHAMYGKYGTQTPPYSVFIVIYNKKMQFFLS